MHLLPHRKSVIEYWPLGTVLIISPWNYPWMLPFLETIMAVTAGNAVILKPSEVTPLTGRQIQTLFEEAGFPKNLVQVVEGDGSTAEALIHQVPSKIFFTGSPATGRLILSAAGKHLIPTSLELGGKNPMIILKDADLELSASMALWGCFSNSGQMCASIERIIVHEDVAEEFRALLAKKANQLRPLNITGTGELGKTTLQRQMGRYKNQYKDAKERGLSFSPEPHFDPDEKP